MVRIDQEIGIMMIEMLTNPALIEIGTTETMTEEIDAATSPKNIIKRMSELAGDENNSLDQNHPHRIATINANQRKNKLDHLAAIST